MSWDYGTRVERALTQEEDFEEGIERFLSDSEPASVPSVEPAPEIRFPPDSGEYETERYLAQSFGFPAFRAFLGLSTTTAHHTDLRNLATLMEKASRTPGDVRTLVLEAGQERLNTGLPDQKKKRGTLAADLKVVCGWLGREVMMKQWRKRSQREDVPKDAARPVESPVVSPVRRIKIRLENPETDQGEPGTCRDTLGVSDTVTAQGGSRILSDMVGTGEPSSHRETPGEGVPSASTSSTLVPEEPTLPTSAIPVTKPHAPSAPPLLPTPHVLSAMDKLMLQSYKNVSASAPSALEAGQEMVLRIGRNADGAYYFKHDVHQNSSARIGYPYRLDGVTMDNVNQVLGLRAVLPRPPVD